MAKLSRTVLCLVFFLSFAALLQAVVAAASHKSHGVKRIPKKVPPKPPQQKPGKNGYALTPDRKHRWEDSSKAGKLAFALSPPPMVPELVSPYSKGNTTLAGNSSIANATVPKVASSSSSGKLATSSPFEKLISTTSTKSVSTSPTERPKVVSTTMPTPLSRNPSPTTTPKPRHRKRQCTSVTVGNKVLILAPTDGSEQSAVLTLKSYGIPYDVMAVPKTGYNGPLPLESGNFTGKYNLIVIANDFASNTSGDWQVALNADQQSQLKEYLVKYNVRHVKFNIYPSAQYGVSVVGSCCDGVEQWLSFDSNAVQTMFPTANLKSSAQITTQGLWHYPARIDNATLAKQVALFAPNSVVTTESVAAVYNKYDDGSEAMIFFIGFGSWSPTSSLLNHAWIHWGTRGAYAGYRRALLSTQIDDLMLNTEPWPTSPDVEGAKDRIVPADMDALVAWQTSINSRLPIGSDFKLEWGINGNGIPANCKNCDQTTDLVVDDLPDTDLNFKKPLGTGLTIWSNPPPKFVWTVNDCRNDPLCNWFLSGNLEHFYLLSHTFTHEYLNNVTYWDCQQEIQFNQQMFKVIGFDKSSKFVASSLIPPSISGVLNGDCIKAWLDTGINNVVGDNSRPNLMDPTNEYWPAISNVAINGYDGLTIIPRWPTNIYYDVGSPSEAVAEYNQYYRSYWGKNLTLTEILEFEATRVSTLMINLRHDSHMFHQLNLRNSDLPQVSLPNGQNGRFSMLQRWVEYVTTAITRVADWPIISDRQDALAQRFLDRKKRDQCGYSVNNVVNGGAIVGFQVSATSGSCTVPVTVPPGTTISESNFKTEQVGADPKTVWVPVTAGSVVSFTISPPVQLHGC